MKLPGIYVMYLFLVRPQKLEVRSRIGSRTRTSAAFKNSFIIHKRIDLLNGR